MYNQIVTDVILIQQRRKKILKKVLVTVACVGTLLAVPIPARAAECLNVRDYGIHRYNYRFEYGKQIYDGPSWTEEWYQNGKKHTVLKWYTYRDVTGICVCGLGATWRDKVPGGPKSKPL